MDTEYRPRPNDILSFEQLYEIVEKLVKAGWRFTSWQYVPVCKGWWLNPDAPIRNGDPKEFYEGARLAFILYTDLTL